ncbi:oxidoreductase [Promicromonospora panici]|uniref:oxidoreductase n=1 Tax=Promicromonospora panici TaxID=2219658 RepID=UPI00101C2F71|nr:oxidoreductase [Promicromonospora panici]
MTSWNAADIPDQTGRLAVVTGANSGVGRVMATELARHGADVVLAVRNLAAGEDAARTIAAAAPGAKLQVRELDLASLASVHAFAEGLAQEHPKIDLLVNNAGLVVLGGRQTTADGFELHLGTNMLGPFALTGLLLPLVARGDQPRVVSLSSITHKTAHLDFADLMSERRYWAPTSYGASKLATTAFAIELDRRLRAAASPVRSALAHPGVSRTNLTPRAWGYPGPIGQLATRLFLLSAQPVERGALPPLFAATAPDVRGGQFFGPDGFRERWGRVTEVRASTEAADPAVGRRLWEVAQEATGVEYL